MPLISMRNKHHKVTTDDAKWEENESSRTCTHNRSKAGL